MRPSQLLEIRMTGNAFDALREQAEKVLIELEADRAKKEEQIIALRKEQLEVDRQISRIRGMIQRTSLGVRQSLQDQVMVILDDTPRNRDQIKSATKMTSVQVNNALTELKEKGKAVQAGYGFWKKAPIFPEGTE